MSAYSAKPAAKRLLELSSEVSRIASRLASLSVEPEPETETASAIPSADRPEVSLETVSAVIRRRGQRTHYFAEELFADPAWDMMLDLLEAEMSNRRVSVSSACIAAGVPASTALRHLKTLEEKRLVVRLADPLDGRRYWIELAPEASVAMRRWFADNLNTVDLK